MHRRWLPALLLFAAAPATAADRYVAADAPPGGDGSEAHPFARIEEAMAVAETGDHVFVGPGVYSHTTPLEVYGQPRRALLVLRPGVHVSGAGPEATILRAPADSPVYVFGISAEGTGRDTVVEDLGIDGPCFQGIQLRAADPVLRNLSVRNPATGASSLAMDVRDGSDPWCVDLHLDGGHSALFVEFGSTGTWVDGHIGRRPNDGLACSGAHPRLVRCTFEGAGRDVFVLNQNSRPSLEDCRFVAPGGRWTVRVASGYAAGAVLDLSGNHWFSRDAEELAAAVHDVLDDPARGLRVELWPLGDAVPLPARSMGRVKASFGGP